jgi:hypothetical protein
MRFYFHLYNDVDTHDEEGTELPDQEAARHFAEQAARAMAAESVTQGHLNLSHYIEVTNDADAVLFRVTFGEVVSVKS